MRLYCCCIIACGESEDFGHVAVGVCAVGLGTRFVGDCHDVAREVYCGTAYYRAGHFLGIAHVNAERAEIDCAFFGSVGLPLVVARAGGAHKYAGGCQCDDFIEFHCCLV